MDFLTTGFSKLIRKIFPFIVLALVAGYVSNSVISAKNITSTQKNSQIRSFQKEQILFCVKENNKKQESFLSKFMKPFINEAPKDSKEQKKNENGNVKNDVISANLFTSTTNNTTANDPTPTIYIQPTTSYAIPTSQPQVTQAVVPTQVVVLPTQTPAPTQIVTTLHITSCSSYDLYYCRTTGQTYNYTRLRVKRSDTGEVLKAETLNNGGGYFSGFPIDTNLDIILLPPIDTPDLCGDIKTIKFLSYHPYMDVELIIRPSGSSPCITP